MTDGDPLAGGRGALAALAALADDDTEGCLCLVGGYSKTDGLIARVTAEAERQVMMSPALGDFLQLRYVDLGAYPGEAGDRSRPLRRIAAELTAARDLAGRSHFALVVIAKSATAIEVLLGSCAAEPFFAGLRMRFAGIASVDDREQKQDFADIASSPTGSWPNERELVDALLQRCEELPRYFAGRGEPGLTRAELAALRRSRDRPAAGGDGMEDGGDAGEAAVPDVLDGVPRATATSPAQDAAQPHVPASAPGQPAVLHRPAAARWLPELPWRRGKQAASVGDPGSAAAAKPARTVTGLVYLLAVVDQDVAADPAIGRLRAALLDVDRRLAAEPSCWYQVRVIQGSDGDLRGELRDAGRLARRDARRSVRAGNFTAVLKAIRGSLRRDGELVQAIATAAGLAVAPPAVVIFAADPPVADPGAAAVFGDLAAEATMVWVVPGELESLVAPAFGTARGAAVRGEHQAVAEEILDLIRGGVPAPEV